VAAGAATVLWEMWRRAPTPTPTPTPTLTLTPTPTPTPTLTPIINGKSHVYIAKGGTPEQNVEKVIQMMGGIQNIVKADDTVIVKPNGQWIDPGYGTSVKALKKLIDLILAHPSSFVGEIVICENTHCRGTNANCDNYRALVNSYGRNNISFIAWSKQGSYVVEGYHDAAELSYPVFTTPLGTYINFKTSKFKFINFPAAKTHSVGKVTCCIKNFLGVVRNPGLSETDSRGCGGEPASGGFHGPNWSGYWMYAAIADFMRRVRKPDLNIVDGTYMADYSYTGKVTETKTVLASIDPVAADYYVTKYLIYPITKHDDHNPDTPGGMGKRLADVAAYGIGTNKEGEMVMQHYSF